MFRKTNSAQQYDLFCQVEHQLQESASRQYSDPEEWHNQFRRHVFQKIDETPFRILFNTKNGAPNASVKRLISMMILKEAFGWSDAHLFNQCKFNVLIRSALGLYNLNDPVPAASTYYLLRERMYQHYIKTKQDLMQEVFQSITYQQVKQFEVEGEHIRMDSTLIGSNIAFYSRYEIIHQSLALFYKQLHRTDTEKLTNPQHEALYAIANEQAHKVVYRSSKHSIAERLQELGQLIWQLCTIFQGSQMQSFQRLCRIFHEHYKMNHQNQIEVRPKQEISSESIQSPHDEDCSYRKKNGQETKGYSYNITETNNPESLNLITDVQVKKATTSDTAFLQPALDQSTQILGTKPDNVYADGAYNSQSNDAYCKAHGINFYLTGFQGTKGKYDLHLTAQGLQVTDRYTGELHKARQIKQNKWRIQTEQGYRYFTYEQIKSCQRRKQVEQLPREIRNRRNNVEATIFQLSIHTRKNKSKYRGLVKQRMWSFARCLWINLVRILKYTGEVCQRTSKLMKTSPLLRKNKVHISFFNIIFDIFPYFGNFFNNIRFKILLFRTILNNRPIFS